jgi:hypothetical protein
MLEVPQEAPGAPLKPRRRPPPERRMLEVPQEAPGAPMKPRRRPTPERRMLEVPREAPGAPMKPRFGGGGEAAALPSYEVLRASTTLELGRMARARDLFWYGTRSELMSVLQEWRLTHA